MTMERPVHFDIADTFTADLARLTGDEERFFVRNGCMNVGGAKESQQSEIEV